MWHPSELRGLFVGAIGGLCVSQLLVGAKLDALLYQQQHVPPPAEVDEELRAPYSEALLKLEDLRTELARVETQLNIERRLNRLYVEKNREHEARANREHDEIERSLAQAAATAHALSRINGVRSR